MGKGVLGVHVAVATVERGRLVRVLAVAQVLHLLQAQRALGRELRGTLALQLGAHPRGDGAVVGRRGLEHVEGQLGARVAQRGAVVGAHLGQDGVVALGARDHGHALEVLRRGAQHRRAADVDVLDAGAEVGPAGHRLLEGVEVHHHHIDHLDAVLGRLGHVGLVVALGQEAAVHARVQRLHAAVHHLGELRHVVDGRDGHAGVLQGAGRAARGDDLRPELVHERAGEVRHARLVRHGHEHALDLRIAHMVLHPFWLTPAMVNPPIRDGKQADRGRLSDPNSSRGARAPHHCSAAGSARPPVRQRWRWPIRRASSPRT